MFSPFTKFQRIEDIKPCIDDDSKLIYPICDNILFAARNCIDPFKEDCCVYDKNKATVVGFYLKQIRLFEEFFDSSIVRYKIILYKKFMPPDKPLYQ